jgi:two-component system response regulator YesN
LGRQRAFIAILGVISKIAQRTEEYTLEHRDEAWRKNHDLVSHATEYINARSCDDFSLDDLAEHCAVSKSRLCHAFRDFTGESPMALRGRIRISRAVDLLKSTDAKTSAIALECGFNDYAAFYRLCKKVTGLNPEDVRKGKG